MCRLAYLPKTFNDMDLWFSQMQDSCGGDGTGIAIGKHARKGVKLDSDGSCQEIWRHHRAASKGRRKKLPVLWHTRRTSSGGDHDDLCHPFPCDGGWLVHNGHFHAFAMEAQKLHSDDSPMSDTRLFSLTVDRHGFTQAVLDIQPPGVWMHMLHDGSLAVWKRGGSLAWRPSDGVLGSEPWQEGRWVAVADGFHDYGHDRFHQPTLGVTRWSATV